MVQKIEAAPKKETEIERYTNHPVSQTIPRHLTKKAISELEHHLEVIRTSTDPQKINDSLDYLYTYKPKAGEEIKIIDALIPLIQKDGANDALHVNTAITILATLIWAYKTTNPPLMTSTLDKAAEAVATHINMDTYLRNAPFFYQASGCLFYPILTARIFAEGSGSEKLPDGFAKKILLPFIEFLGQSPPIAFGSFSAVVNFVIYANSHGSVDQNTIDLFAQKFKEFVLSGKESARDRAAFLGILCLMRLDDKDYENILMQWALHSNPDPFYKYGSEQKWLFLLLKNEKILNTSNLIYELKQRYDALDETDLQKSILGGCITAWCFHRPELLEQPEFEKMLGLEPVLARMMLAQKPGWETELNTPNGNLGMRWAFENIFTGFEDYVRIWEVAQKYKGDPIVKTLFEQNNIVRFGNYPMDVIEHLYYDRERTSEKPIMFMVFTKRPYAVEFGTVFEKFDYKKFDIRVIEPGSDEKMASLMKETSARLGKKFSYLIVNGHGDTMHILLRRNQRPGNEYLDLGDMTLLKDIKPLMVPGPDIVLNACLTAQGEVNLAEFVAQNLSARCFGNTMSSGVKKILFDNDLHITAVEFDGAEARVYDYRAINPIKVMRLPPVMHVGSTFIIPNTYTKKTECAIYDLSGRLISKLRPDASNNFVWDAAGAAAGLYLARIADGGKTTTLKLNKM